MLFVTEIFCHGKSGLSDTHTGSWWLVHLSEYHGRLIDNAGFFHLIVEVITLTGTLSNTGKYGVSTVLRCDVVDQLLDQYGLTYTGSTEQTDLTTLLVRAEKINDLDTGL